MKKNVLLTVAAVASFVTAAEFNASVQGDVASLSYWQNLGYTSLPGSGDTLKLSGRATDPMYYASVDMTVFGVLFSTSGAYIDLTQSDGSLRTITLTSTGTAMEFPPKNSGFLLKGGKWMLANKGNVVCGRAKTSSQDNHNITFNGCVVTNANRFYGTYFDRDTTINIVEGAEIYAENLYPSYGNFATNSAIFVSGGSKLVSFSRMIQGDGFDANEDGALEVGGNLVDVSGEGTLLKIGDKSILGHKVPHNELRIRDGAKFESGSIFVGNMLGFNTSILLSGTGTDADTGGIFLGNETPSYNCGFSVTGGVDWYSSGQLAVGVASYGNYAEFSASTGSCGLVTLGEQATSSNNVFTVDSASELTLRSGTMFEVGVTGSCNRAEIKGGSIVKFSSKGWFTVGKEASSTGNVLRISGEGTAVVFPGNDPVDPFGAGERNTFILEDGAVLDGYTQLEVASVSSNNRFTVRNTVFGMGHGHLGQQSTASSCRGNTFEVLDGAEVSFLSFSISAFDNTLFVSNSTFYADDPTRGMRIGYLEDAYPDCASNSTVRIAGEKTSVVTTGPLTVNNHSRLHFSIPRKGWASAPVKALRMSFSANAGITVDCEEFCQYTGGGITLVETENGIDNKRIDQVLAAANAAEDLPPRARFYVSGNNLMFRSPHVKGTVMVLR